MASQTVLTCLMAVLCAPLCAAAPVSPLGVFVRPSVSVRNGHTTTLPCWLSPSQSAEGLEVRWYRKDHFDSPVMLYIGNKFESASQDAKYAGRVSFGLKDATSAGLTAGDVSLQLINATLKDAGDYICYVTSDQGYDSGSVKLTVTETGTVPLMSPVWKEDNKVNVSCESEGWYPKPSVRWSDKQQQLNPKSVKYSADSSGLQSVHSWVLVSSSSEVSCSVGLSGEEAKEARLRLENHLQPESGSSSGWVAFAVLLLIGLIAGILGFLYFKKRGKKTEEGSGNSEGKKTEEGSGDAEEMRKPLLEVSEAAETHYVNVTLDETGNPYLTIREIEGCSVMVRDTKNIPFPDGQNVTCLTAIKGSPGFSSGQHYWEVSMERPEIGLKQSWWLGVTSAADIPRESDFTPSPSNGYWFLASSPHRADRFHFNTEPHVLLPVCSRPQTVGVYLNYDSGELSFYDVQNKSLIGSLTVKFTGKVFPLFNPGKDDKAPMEILHKVQQDQSDNTGAGDPPSNPGKDDKAPGQGQSSDTESRDSTAQ